MDTLGASDRDAAIEKLRIEIVNEFYHENHGWIKDRALSWKESHQLWDSLGEILKRKLADGSIISSEKTSAEPPYKSPRIEIEAGVFAPRSFDIKTSLDFRGSVTLKLQDCSVRISSDADES